MGTKNNPGDFDCYANAEDDEPMFVLLARDKSAPSIVRRWAKRYLKKHTEAISVTERVMRKHAEALQCAKAMEAWQKGQ